MNEKKSYNTHDELMTAIREYFNSHQRWETSPSYHLGCKLGKQLRTIKKITQTYLREIKEEKRTLPKQKRGLNSEKYINSLKNQKK